MCEMKEFTRRWTNPLCILGVIGGLLPCIILMLLLSVYHKVQVPYCVDCIEKTDSAKKIQFYGRIALAATIPFLFIEYALIGTVFFSLICFLAGLVATIVGSFQVWSRGPKYKATKREFVEVATPNGQVLRFDKE